jgi:hypothetical protein
VAYKFINVEKPTVETAVVSHQGQEWQDAERRSKRKTVDRTL